MRVCNRRETDKQIAEGDKRGENVRQQPGEKLEEWISHNLDSRARGMRWETMVSPSEWLVSIPWVYE